MKAIIIISLSLLLLVSCAIAPEKTGVALNFNEPEGEYLTVTQEREAHELMSALNEKVEGVYWLWMEPSCDNATVKQKNADLEKEGIIGIYIDVCKDGQIYIDSLDAEIVAMADEVNTMNTNSFSRVMFYVDNIAMYLTGEVITVYNPDKDIMR